MSLKSLRRQAGISQEELARRIGLTQGYISKLERGKRNKYAVTVETIDKIAIALNMWPPIVYMHFSSLCCNCKFLYDCTGSIKCNLQKERKTPE